MKKTFLNLLIFCFFISFLPVFAFDQEINTDIVPLLGGRKAEVQDKNLDNDGVSDTLKERKNQKKKKGKGKVIKPADDDVVLTLDRVQEEDESVENEEEE